jgi:hypothetical protein
MSGSSSFVFRLRFALNWRRELAGRRRSGLSVREYCRKHHISKLSFYWWRRKPQPRELGAINVLPVRVIPEQRDGRTACGAVEIVLSNGRCVRGRPGFVEGLTSGKRFFVGSGPFILQFKNVYRI